MPTGRRRQNVPDIQELFKSSFKNWKVVLKDIQRQLQW